MENVNPVRNLINNMHSYSVKDTRCKNIRTSRWVMFIFLTG